MHFIYIILCEDGSLYTGISDNVERRFLAHQSKKGGHYTASHKPVKIVYKEASANKSEALKREARIKRLSRKEKLHLIENEPPTSKLVG